MKKGESKLFLQSSCGLLTSIRLSHRIFSHERLFHRRLFHRRLFYRRLFHRKSMYRRLFCARLFHWTFSTGSWAVSLALVVV